MTLDGLICAVIPFSCLISLPRCSSPSFCHCIYGLLMYNVKAFIMPFQFYPARLPFTICPHPISTTVTLHHHLHTTTRPTTATTTFNQCHIVFTMDWRSHAARLP